jgi:hypothetical protein
MTFIQFTLIAVVMLFIYYILKKFVEKFISLKETDITTPLSEFRESHAASVTVKKGLFNIQEGIVGQYENKCILNPIPHKNDPSLPKIIAEYKKIISGDILDPHGYNIPSREILGKHNPDYDKYIHNQAQALKTETFSHQASILFEEEKRIKEGEEKEELRNEIMGLLIAQNIPPLVVHAAMSEKKLETYTSENWVSFYKKVKEYLEISDRSIVNSFVENTDDLSIILDEDMFNKFSTFYKHSLPVAVIMRLITEEITDDQAARALVRVELFHISFEKALEDIQAMDNKTTEEEALRKSYGFMAG